MVWGEAVAETPRGCFPALGICTSKRRRSAPRSLSEARQSTRRAATSEDTIGDHPAPPDQLNHISRGPEATHPLASRSTDVYGRRPPPPMKPKAPTGWHDRKVQNAGGLCDGRDHVDEARSVARPLLPAAPAQTRDDSRDLLCEGAMVTLMRTELPCPYRFVEIASTILPQRLANVCSYCPSGRCRVVFQVSRVTQDHPGCSLQHWHNAWTFALTTAHRIEPPESGYFFALRSWGIGVLCPSIYTIGIACLWARPQATKAHGILDPAQKQTTSFCSNHKLSMAASRHPTKMQRPSSCTMAVGTTCPDG